MSYLILYLRVRSYGEKSRTIDIDNVNYISQKARIKDFECFHCKEIINVCRNR
jgi:hypothetical protein